MRSPRTRPLLRIGIALLIGLLCAALSAWIPAIIHGAPGNTILALTTTKTHLSKSGDIWSSSTSPLGVTEVVVLDRVSPMSAATHEPPSWANTDPSFAGMSTFAYGWPARSSRMVWACGSGEPYTHTLGPALNFSLRGHPAALPITPIPTGFAINTLFYTLLALTTISLFRHIQRTRRRRLNRCTHCGYALQAIRINTCPECGQSAPPSR